MSLSLQLSPSLSLTIIATIAADGVAASKSAYIRYVVPTPDDEEATVEYDLDEEDEQWLQQYSRQVTFSLSATCNCDKNLLRK